MAASDMIIKLFEEFSNLQYEEIQYSEYIEITTRYKFIDFTEREKKQISNFGVCNDHIRNIIFLSLKTDPHGIFNQQNTFNIQIYKMPDEWFYIKADSKSNTGNVSIKGEKSISIERFPKYYKCDQFSGLIECLSFIKQLKIAYLPKAK